MIGLAKLCAMCSIAYIVKLLFYPYFKPVSRRQKKRSRLFMKQRKQIVSKTKWQAAKRHIAESYIKPLLSQAERDRFKKMIERLDLTMTPEEVRLEQLMYTMGAILITLLMAQVNFLLGCVSAIFIILGWLYPVEELEKRIDRKNRQISLDFPSFYSMVYYQYARSVNIHLADVIKDYIPNANLDMAEELGVMLDNMEYGEEFALKQLKKRVPLHYIIKFCDMMETRLKGYDNVSQMAYLKNEVDGYRIRALEDELQKRERSNARIQLILIVILIGYIIVYYLFMILGSLKMFQ